MKYIFDEIIETKSIYIVIEKTFPDDKERQHMITVVKDIVHHKVVDMILDELDENKKLVFIEKLDDENQHRNILNDLSIWILDFESKVISKVKEAEKELLQIFRI